jgi:hypothetical protein
VHAAPPLHRPNLTCGAAGGLCAAPAPAFAARIRLSIDDQQCPGNGGGRLTIALAGQRVDGGQFTIPDTTVDFCGVEADRFSCGGNLNLCTENPLPRETVFLCTTVVPNGQLDEQAVPDAFWLTYSNFPAPVAAAIAAAFPGTAGAPLILTATDQSFTDGLATAAPSVREVCITGTLAMPVTSLVEPAALAALPATTATASLSLGDCPTLPIVTTTSTTSTTLPPNLPCDGLTPNETVRCLVDQGARSCANAVPPSSIARLRSKAAASVAKALTTTKPRRRAARLAAAIDALRSARRKVPRLARAEPACRTELIPALDAANAFVSSLSR